MALLIDNRAEKMIAAINFFRPNWSKTDTPKMPIT
jgi:hypothetical protein